MKEFLAPCEFGWDILRERIVNIKDNTAGSQPRKIADR